ncbi:hypothetical protein [Pseudogemmobacter bohemicus]|uniref:hypothetical protein n=1 Tax=Pseudogemmobacter bohemicus TaxID=2250708 RepID=UPI001300B04F|nr:hypothetical protein [Pseudogemmobacter bohemicus]
MRKISRAAFGQGMVGDGFTAVAALLRQITTIGVELRTEARELCVEPAVQARRGLIHRHPPGRQKRSKVRRISMAFVHQQREPFLAGGRYRFVGRVSGGADVVTPEGQIDPFDVVSLAQCDGDSPLLVDLLIDLTQLDKGMGLYVEAGNRGMRPVLMIERRIGHDPVPLEPGPIDRALARYLTLLAGLALVFLQLLSVPGARSGAAPTAPAEPPAASPRLPESQAHPLAPPDPPPLAPPGRRATGA